MAHGADGEAAEDLDDELVGDAGRRVPPPAGEVLLHRGWGGGEEVVSRSRQGRAMLPRA